MSVLGQQLVDRSVFQAITEQSDRVVEAALVVRRAKGHAPSLPSRGANREHREVAKSAVT